MKTKTIVINSVIIISLVGITLCAYWAYVNQVLNRLNH